MVSVTGGKMRAGRTAKMAVQRGYAARSGSTNEDWPPNFGYKKRAAGEPSRVLAQARVTPMSRKWHKAEQSNKVLRLRFRYSIRMQGPGSNCVGASGSVIVWVPLMLRALW